MLRILQVVAPARFGGLERVVHALAAGQRARGHDAHVFSVVSPGEADALFHDRLLGSQVQLHVAEVPARAYLRERKTFRDLCRRLHPDVVHMHGHRPDVVDRGVSRSLGIPTVTTMHGLFHGGDWKGRLRERLQLAAFRRFDAVVAVSKVMADDLRRKGVPPGILTAIPNAWCEASPFLSRAEARRALGIPEGAFVAGWVGRVTPQKALEVAIDALARLADVPVTLSIVGDGEDRSRIEEHARAAGLENRLRWHGARESAHELMRAFDVFVLSSRWEGTPIVLFEAMAAGVPVVTTAVGGVPDVVSDREAALVPAEDAQALADAVRGVYSSPEPAARRAAAALQRLQNEFGVEPWLDRYDALYERLIKARRR